MCSHSAFKGLTNRAVCIICEHLHIPFVDGESAYLKLGLRHVMWIFLKNYFFPHELPVGFCKRAVFQFLVNLICGVCVLDMLRGVSIVEFHMDCACLDHSSSPNARLELFSIHFMAAVLVKLASVLHARWVTSPENS